MLSEWTLSGRTLSNDIVTSLCKESTQWLDGEIIKGYRDSLSHDFYVFMLHQLVQRTSNIQSSQSRWGMLRPAFFHYSLKFPCHLKIREEGLQRLLKTDLVVFPLFKGSGTTLLCTNNLFHVVDGWISIHEFVIWQLSLGRWLSTGSIYSTGDFPNN